MALGFWDVNFLVRNATAGSWRVRI